MGCFVDLIRPGRYTKWCSARDSFHCEFTFDLSISTQSTEDRVAEVIG
jgi:hypothetical protein